MTIHFSYRPEPLHGTYYVFDTAGEYIKEHKHPEHDIHNVECIKGRVRIDGPNLEIAAGGIATFDSTLPHSIVALEDGTEILNRVFNWSNEEMQTLRDWIPEPGEDIL